MAYNIGYTIGLFLAPHVQWELIRVVVSAIVIPVYFLLRAAFAKKSAQA